MSAWLGRTLVWGLCGVALLAGCGDDDSGDTAAACESFKACGGDVVGTWQLDGVCLEELDQLLGNMTDQPECNDFIRTGRIHPQGTYTFGSDGMYMTTGASFTFELDVVLTSACASALNGTKIVVDSAVCQRFESNFAMEGTTIAAASCSFGANRCACTVNSVPMAIDEAGTYSVTGTDLVDASGPSPFCVDGNTLTIKGMSAMGINGAIVLRR